MLSFKKEYSNVEVLDEFREVKMLKNFSEKSSFLTTCKFKKKLN